MALLCPPLIRRLRSVCKVRRQGHEPCGRTTVHCFRMHLSRSDDSSRFARFSFSSPHTCLFSVRLDFLLGRSGIRPGAVQRIKANTLFIAIIVNRQGRPGTWQRSFGFACRLR